jgi:hypothetical protein
MPISPDESAKQQQKILEKYRNLPVANQSRDDAEDAALLNNVTKNTYDNVTGGAQTTDWSKTMAKFANDRAASSVAQDARMDGINQQSAMAKESIAAQKQQTALRNRTMATDDKEQNMKRAIAQRAFDMGMTGKELALHSDSALADLGFEQTKKDFDAGRVTQQELMKITIEFAKRAQVKQQETEKMLQQLKNDMQKDLLAKDIDRAKARLTVYYNKLKEQAKDAAKAANNAAIVNGIFGIGGAVAGGLIGGPGGAAIGSSVGGVAASTVNAQQ